MLKNRNILCMSNPTWKGDYAKTIVEIMQVLGRENNILYVENPATWLDVLRSKNIKKILKRIFSGASVDRISPKIMVLSPGPVIPVNFLPAGKWYSLLQGINNRKIHGQVKRLLESTDMRRELIHVNAFNPLVAKGNFGKFNERTTVYYCYDEISAAHYMKTHGTYLEKELLKEADITVVSSEGLYETKKALAKSIALVKNGVNFRLFSSGFTEVPPVKPLIGYLGSIDDRLDQPLLELLFTSFPGWQFEFVGRINDGPTGEFLKRFENVSFAGAHPVSSLPGFLTNYSAGIIPFVKNEFTKGIYPLKINEYLAAGLPVVLTDFGKMDEFRDIAVVAANKEQFVEGLRQEVEQDNVTKRHNRKNRASLNSWESRAGDFSHAITEYESRHPAK